MDQSEKKEIGKYYYSPNLGTVVKCDGPEVSNKRGIPMTFPGVVISSTMDSLPVGDHSKTWISKKFKAVKEGDLENRNLINEISNLGI